MVRAHLSPTVLDLITSAKDSEPGRDGKRSRTTFGYGIKSRAKESLLSWKASFICFRHSGMCAYRAALEICDMMWWGR
ncbi:hypothetical protein N7475_007325 [Penicillium sp. IBT 31633x]|nr:hypothetical protein N7475_007325 [Penicillium sp. IBT 31633x]